MTNKQNTGGKPTSGFFADTLGPRPIGPAPQQQARQGAPAPEQKGSAPPRAAAPPPKPEPEPPKKKKGWF